MCHASSLLQPFQKKSTFVLFNCAILLFIKFFYFFVSEMKSEPEVQRDIFRVCKVHKI
ncbi:hypothetical protein MtrunA17_Chr4g0032991 [Medicago truncatula]|uniref:Transmembrane protein n=1 Tax=Medicago truncatula TaxID=3880 RepID=A0A396I683_MEDTR|nr:hypothetical protein MtrunA17_Chr4g0032991 [Medicago truncatula]